VSDNKILVIPADLAKKIDENCGDMSRAEFIEALIDNLITDNGESKQNVKTEFITRTELLSFEQDMKQLLKSFLDFFMAYDLELGENGQQVELEKFTNKLQGLQKDLCPADNGSKGGGKATIKWKA
jgi:metal-responsive CopG/Arc/MetJ family transcriptional regulator